MISRNDVPSRIAEILGRKVRWAASSRVLGNYDGYDRTVEIFDADAREQRALLRRLRPERTIFEDAAGGPLVLVFHTRSETARLYPQVLLEERPRGIRYSELADALAKWMVQDHDGQEALNPNEIERFSFDDERAA